MTVKLSTGLRNALLGQDGMSKIFTGGVIELRSGVQPVTADAAPTGTLLGVVTVNGQAWIAGNPANGLVFAAPNGGVLTKNSDHWMMFGLAAGTIGWWRLITNAPDDGSASTTLRRIDGSAGVGAGDLWVSTTNVTVGSPATADVFAIELPAS